MKSADSRRPDAPAEQLLTAKCIGEGSTDVAIHAETGLVARFLWSEDRYIHRVEAGVIPLMQTVLRDSTLEWPDDPPLQQLSIETLGEQTVALGVGSAGTSHWSHSIEALSGTAPALRYDLACRCRVAPVQLASTFEMLANGARFSVDRDETVTIDGLACGTVQILPEPSIGPVRWKIGEGGRVLSIAADLSPSSNPATVRWGFRVAWQPAPRTEPSPRV